MPRGDGRTWVRYNASEQNELRRVGGRFVPWGYFLARTRAGVRSGPIHHTCAVALLEAREEPHSGGRRLRRENGLDYRGAPRLRDICGACGTPLINTRHNYRLRVNTLPLAVAPDVFWSRPRESRLSGMWTVAVPEQMHLEPIRQHGLGAALVAMRERIPEAWGVSDPVYQLLSNGSGSISFRQASWDGLDGTVAHQRRIQQQERRQAAHQDTITNYAGEVSALWERIAAGDIELERMRAQPGERIDRTRLAEFLDRLVAVRSWELAQGSLTLHLWPVKLYSTRQRLAVITTPHTWTVQSSSTEGFTIAVQGAHPHWAGSRYCSGDYSNHMAALLARGNILQALRLLLELRRGWNERDQYVNIQHVCETALRQFSRSVAGFQFYEDGLTGEMHQLVERDAAMIGRRASAGQARSER